MTPDTLDQFLLRLDDVRPQGHGQWTSKCPVPDHADRHASLSVAAGEKGIALHCHAGCQPDEVCEAVGWELRDLFFNVVPIGAARNNGGPVKLPAPVPPTRSPAGETRNGNGRAPKGGVSMPPAMIVEAWQARIAEVADRLAELKGWSLKTLERLGVGFDGERVVFPAYDVQGRLVSVVRYKPGHQPKTLAVGVREPWPAPESISAESVLVVEGEPDRVSACELGYDAVALPGAAIFKDDWPERFRGKRVTVCLDCDREGREAAARVVGLLGSAGVECRAIDLDPSRDDGLDIGECLALAVREGRVGDLAAFLLRLEREAWS